MEPRPPDRMISALVVDDALDAAQTLATVMTLAGFDVRAATSGAAALRSATEAPPDVVILDLRMPGMDGFELARRLREHPWPGKYRPLLVAVSGLGSDEDRARAAEAGVDVHLVKPVDPAGLVRLLHLFRSAGGLPHEAKGE